MPCSSRVFALPAAIALGAAAGMAASLTAAPPQILPARGEVLQLEAEPVSGSLENVCHLTVRRVRSLFFPSTFNSSAVLFRERYLITAAHNVHSTTWSKVTSVSAACGRANPAPDDHVQVDLAAIRVAPGYSWRKWDRDFAVVALPNPLRVTSPVTIRPITEQDALSPAHVAGFPGTDEPGAPETMDGRHMFSAEIAPRLDPSSFLARYALKTHTGNSGGPVWYETPAGPVLLGIHVFGAKGPKSDGVARRLDSEIDAIEAMIASLGSTGEPATR